MSIERRNRCPYCGRRVSYFSQYLSRRKAEYVCDRCGKESRVVISKAVIPVFLVFVVISLGIMAAWIVFDLSSNPMGVAAVALPLLVFLLISPKYVRFEALKKYKDVMEAKRAGIEYSDSFAISEIDEEASSPSEKIQIDSDLFNKIKQERGTVRGQTGSDELISHSGQTERSGDGYENIADVREEHSEDDTPLKKISSEHTIYSRRHYFEDDEDLSTDVEEYEKPSGSRYTSDRRF